MSLISAGSISLDSAFNNDLSNEPNFGRIHLAGQYCIFKMTKKVKVFDKDKAGWSAN